jgi:hypothetical protein
MTIHHYVPKCKGGTLKDTLRMCKTCHSYLHSCIDLEDVEHYNTYEKLEEHAKFSKYLKWVRTLTHPSMITIKKINKKLNE